MQGHQRKLIDAGEDGHCAHSQVAAVGAQRGIEAHSNEALRALHDKGRKTQRNAGAEALPVQVQVHGTKL